MSYISFKNIEKFYDTYHALKNISLDIQKGEFVVLLGPSGSGKSTLLRILSGLEEVQSGQIILDNEDVTNIPPAERNLAMVFQNYALYPHMNVYQNMAYGLKNRKIDKNEIHVRIEKAAEMLEISHLLERKPSALSGGQRQRVAMGRAIVRQPKVFLFDEPLSNLDAQLRSKMRIEIRNLQQRLNITTIFVTHDQVEAMTMADKIILMNHAEIVQIGTPSELYDNPNSIFAARFVGSPRIGLLTLNFEHNMLSDCYKNFQIRVTKNSHQLVDHEILLGIRPEHFFMKESDNALKIKVYVNHIENMGSCYYLHTSLENSTLNTVREHGLISIYMNSNDIHHFEVGSQYDFYFDTTKVKLFCKQTGVSLGFLSEYI